jgi:hypothetical protein
MPQDQATDPNISPQVRWWLGVQARYRARGIQVEARDIVVAVRAARARSDATALSALAEQIDRLAVRAQLVATTASAATQAPPPRVIHGAVVGLVVGLTVGLVIGYGLRTP